MIERLELISYPVESNGMPVDPRNIYDFDNSNLNLDRTKNWNRHHLLWQARDYNQQLYFCLRSLESHQLYMPVDIHDTLHDDFEPPAKPRPNQAYERLEEALERQENLVIRGQKVGGKVLRVITAEDLLKCKASCDSLMRRWA